jgi:hypothetical protein
VPEAPGTAAQRDQQSGWKIVQAADFNRDSQSDVLWNDPTTNRMTVALMRGAHLLEQGPILPGPPGEGWVAVTAADFNGDGMNDVLWFNAHTNRIVIWLMHGLQVVAVGPEIPGPGDGWVAVQAGDTNADGMADVVWHDAATSRMAVWLMHGEHLLEAGPEIPTPPDGPWTIVNTGDCNLDGMQDIIWYRAQPNRVRVDLMSGAHLVACGPEIPGPAGEGWVAATTGDFNADGKADVVWTNAGTGRMAIWLMNGVQLLAAGPEIQGPGGEGWAVSTAGDCNQDGMNDAFWHDAVTNRMAVSLMSGAELLAPGPEIAGPP